MPGSKNNMNRRRFLQISSGSVAAMLVARPPASAGALAPATGRGTPAERRGLISPQERGSLVSRAETERPNVLWVSCEDTSPDLGCYGDSYAVTPNIDKLAGEGVRYTNVYTNAGVCAPSRSGIITGMYPTTIGTHHMRCSGVPPAEVKCFSEYLRAAGYYCTNNSKTDYQFGPPLTAWDECNNKAHWRNRAEDQPFFAIFNFTTSHESQIRNRSEGMLKRLASLAPHEKHDPAKAVLPPYYPDTPMVRRDWAQYYDVVTLMDKQVGDVLKQLEADGLAEDTIVWFWGDHGRGLPRAKRWIYDSGIRAPLIIRVPEKWRRYIMPDNPNAVKPGTVNDELIAFIDFAPTMLSLAGVKIPKHIQGQAFLGSQKTGPRDYVFAARDRMDEAYDLIRAVRDKRYKYIRNYMPYLTRAQDIEYMNEMPTMQEMRRLAAEGKLKGPQEQYFEPTKPVEELYDTLNDPHEVNNLAGDAKYRNVLERMRKVHALWVRETGDVGLIPEPEFDEMKRPAGQLHKTADPQFLVVSRKQDAISVKIGCATPGASIAYKFRTREKESGWRLYNETLLLAIARGTVIVAKACRIGFKDSNEVRFQFGDEDAERPAPVESGDHWREKLDKTDVLQRLRKIKELDHLGREAIPRYFEALNDEYASVRYWAAVGLHYNCKDGLERKQAQAALQKMLEDPVPVVRVAAAHALCDWGQEKEALPILVEALSCKTDKARLYAIIALNKIGQIARPALEQIKAHEKDSDNYVQRVTRATVKRLEIT